MRPVLTRSEALLLAGCLLLTALALFAPALAQPLHPHDFADQRTLAGLPHALDVLSNLPFLLAAAFGGWSLRQRGAGLPRAERACAALFFAGLAVVAAGSSWYHFAPDDFGLAIDRASMGVAFAGLLGLLACTQVSERAGVALATALLVLAPLGVAAWFRTGNVLPWALVQFGGMPLLAFAALRRPREQPLQVRWVGVLLAYAVAKWFETNDALVFQASGELLSGHTLKHLVAALAAWPVIAAVAGPRGRQNGLRNRAATA